MYYSHLGIEVLNGAISITQRGFISGCYKVKSIGQWENILVMALGFVDHFRLYLLPLGKSQVCEIEATMEKSIIDTP